MTAPRRSVPRWWHELAWILVGYWLYSLTRNAIHSSDTVAVAHAVSLRHVEQRLGFDFELSVNRWVADHNAVAQVMNYYYATLHFVVTIGVLVWVYRQRPEVYRAARTVLFGATAVGMAGFYLFPLAPPRLLPRYGYVDTLVHFRTWGSLADPKVAAHSNQFAAMPSLHVAWALWAGLTVYLCARPAWIRRLGLAYPVATFVVVIGTANHFALDAVGGAVALAAGVGVRCLLVGRTRVTPALAHERYCSVS